MSLLPESAYSYKVLLDNFLGLSLYVSDLNSPYVRISIGDDDSRALLVKNILEPWSGGDPIPWESFELRCLPMEFDGVIPKPEEKDLPVLEAKGSSGRCSITRDGDIITLDFDLFGTAFYILSRVEESVNPERDSHDRFPASASHALQNGYLHRPVVNEMVEILWDCLKALWPGMERKKREFQMKLTHDVDQPFRYRFLPPSNLFKNICGDLLKRKSLSLAVERGRDWFSVKTGALEKDPYYKFNLIMALGEKRGIADDFFFLASEDYFSERLYDISRPEITDLMKLIKGRGHNIGYHGSYSTYMAPSKIASEVHRLREISDNLGIQQSLWGGRQHYLRWKGPLTWRGYEEAGLAYDSTLSYADYAGFRCGVCYPFPVFDIERRKTLDLVEIPLAMMECSLLSDIYMGLSIEDAYDFAVGLKREVRKYQGSFCILWHNSEFYNQELVDLYDAILGA